MAALAMDSIVVQVPVISFPGYIMAFSWTILGYSAVPTASYEVWSSN